MESGHPDRWPVGPVASTVYSLRPFAVSATKAPDIQYDLSESSAPPREIYRRNLFSLNSYEANTAKLNTAKPILKKMTIPDLTSQLTASLRKPTRRTLSLINKALSYLTPFEQSTARTASASERQALLQLLNAHRPLLAPYLDTDRIESHLRHGAQSS